MRRITELGNKYYVCITIPVFHPDRRLNTCLEEIARQEIDESIAVLIIDSSGNQDVLKDLELWHSSKVDLIYKTIDPHDFQHGRTRNLTRDCVDSDYYVFITQDAVPANTEWLNELIKPLTEDAMIAGSYSRHIAHRDHSYFCKAELDSFFEQLSRYSVVDKSMLMRAGNQKERDLMKFFSNNSSCIRGSVFKQVAPFPEVDFAEDQAWSAKAIELGYKKAICMESVISHSHMLTLAGAFGRGLDEALSYRDNENRKILGGNPLAIVRMSLLLFARDLETVRKTRGNNRLALLKESPVQALRRISQSLGTYVGSSKRLSSLLGKFSRDRSLKMTRRSV